MTLITRIRHWFLPLMASIVVLVGLSAGVAANSGAGLPGWGSSTGSDLKAGPLGLNPKVDNGQVPVAISIPDADVDAEVETQQIVNGQMLDPSGPWVVSWYEQTSPIGARGNTVMSGHVDYWDVGDAVFYAVENLQPGARIDVIGDDDVTYTYELEYIERIDLATLTPERLNSPELVGQTDYAALTLITCGGEFDYERGEYLQRDILRARLISKDGSASVSQPAADTQTDAPAAEAGALAEGGQATVSETGVNLRSEPTTNGAVVTTLSTGDVVTLTGPSQEAEDYVWWPVTTADGEQGWVAEDFLTPAAAQ